MICVLRSFNFNQHKIFVKPDMVKFHQILWQVEICNSHLSRNLVCVFVFEIKFILGDQYLKLLMKASGSKLFGNSNCCVCGLTNCRQSIDHRSISLKQFSHLINSAKMPNTELEEIKQTVTKFYHKLKGDLIAMIEADSNHLQQQLNKFYFPHINSEKVNMAELCQYANGQFAKLPNKRVLKIMSALRRRQTINDEINKSLQFQQFKQDILSFISEFQKKKQTEKIKINLPFASIIEKAVPQTILKRSESDISNPEQIDEQAAKKYTWKNVTIKSRSKTLELSNKNIDDLDLLHEMPAISSFKNIKQFEIRNNKITSFSCKIIGSNMSHVRTIDIRCNNIGDEGVIAIVKAIPQLKSFMISETKCTSLSASAIYTHLKDIEVLWCEQNYIDDEHAILVGQLTKLKVLSFLGNGLEQETGDILKKIFCNKGYVIV